MGLPKLPCCPGAGARPHPEISPGAAAAAVSSAAASGTAPAAAAAADPDATGSCVEPGEARPLSAAAIKALVAAESARRWVASRASSARSAAMAAALAFRSASS